MTSALKCNVYRCVTCEKYLLSSIFTFYKYKDIKKNGHQEMCKSEEYMYIEDIKTDLRYAAQHFNYCHLTEF